MSSHLYGTALFLSSLDHSPNKLQQPISGFYLNGGDVLTCVGPIF